MDRGIMKPIDKIAAEAAKEIRNRFSGEYITTRKTQIIGKIIKSAIEKAHSRITQEWVDEYVKLRDSHASDKNTLSSEAESGVTASETCNTGPKDDANASLSQNLAHASEQEKWTVVEEPNCTSYAICEGTKVIIGGLPNRITAKLIANSHNATLRRHRNEH